jgi:uncharacterized repeat protein (TIGR01451 family)
VESNRFVQMVKTLSTAGTRRGVLQRLTALPLVGALAALFGEDEGAANRRRKAKRRVGTENHKHAGRRRKHKKRHKKTCTPKSHANTCAGKCGIVKVKNACKQRVDCGSCGCTPLATCPPDLDCDTIADGCGGTISCGECSNPALICVNNVCTAAAGIDLTKSSDATGLVVASVITYTFLVENTGQIDLEDVVVTDPLLGLSAITCPGTSLAAGASFECTASYVVTQDDVDAGEITNTATVTGAAPGNVVVTDDDSLVIPPN